MKIDFNKPIKELNGKTIQSEGKDLTLRDVACNSLCVAFTDEQISGEEKARRGLLAMRLYANPDIDLTLEELALIKKVIGKGYGPIVVAQAWAMLEGRKEQ